MTAQPTAISAIVAALERARRWTHATAFAIDRFPATNRRYTAFVAAGGYGRGELWSERGWQERTVTGHAWPQGWEPDTHPPALESRR